jgi:hypothetical protein
VLRPAAITSRGYTDVCHGVTPKVEGKDQILSRFPDALLLEPSKNAFNLKGFFLESRLVFFSTQGSTIAERAFQRR